MNRVRQPFNTSLLAQAAALAALGDEGHVEMSFRVNLEGKAYLYKELDRCGIDYLPTQANFIYMELKQDAGAIYEKLLRQGVIARPMGPTQLRVTIGLKEENERFIGALEKVL